MIRNCLAGAFAALLLGMAAAPVAAQGHGRGRSTPLALLTMHNFATCVVNRSPDGAARLMAQDPTQRAYHDAVRRFARGNDDCAENFTLIYSEIYFIGGVSEALVVKAMHRQPQFGPLVAPDPARPPIRARDETEMMTLCTVLTAPEATWALFEADPDSAAELTAFRALGPTIGGCLANNRTLTLDRGILRARLALAAYRLVAYHQTPPAP